MIHGQTVDVSVLIPTLVIDQFTYRSVCSAISQGAKQVVLIHDGGLIEENHLKKIQALNIDLVINDQTLGVSKRLNQGISYCNSQYIARLDSDDISLPGRFQLQVKYLDECRADFIFGNEIRCNLNGDRILSFKRPSLQGEALNSLTLLAGNPIVHPTVMMRANWIKSIGGYPECISEDYALWINGALSGSRGMHLNKELIKRSYHPGQISKNIHIGELTSQLLPIWTELLSKNFSHEIYDHEKLLRQILSLNRDPQSVNYSFPDNFLIKFFTKCLTSLDPSQHGQRRWIRSQILLSKIEILRRR